jgi:hypothetical protein
MSKREIKNTCYVKKENNLISMKINKNIELYWLQII